MANPNDISLRARKDAQTDLSHPGMLAVARIIEDFVPKKQQATAAYMALSFWLADRTQDLSSAEQKLYMEGWLGLVLGTAPLA